MRALAILATLAVLSTPLYAQRGLYEVKNPRHGFWASLGVGGSSIGIDCSGCVSNRTGGTAGFLRLGGTLTRQLLLGVEVAAGGPTGSDPDETMAALAVDLFWYPGAGAFYMKIGAGGMGYRRDNTVAGISTRTEETGPAGTLGAGYDFRVGRNISISPFLNVIGSTDVKRTVNGTDVITNGNVNRNMVQLGVGITLH